MIRRDYILKMIQEVGQVIARIRSLRKDQRLSEAGECLDVEVQRLLALPVQAVAALSQTELLALVIKSESTLPVREKALVLAALLKEAGDISVEQNRDLEGRSYYLKGLHLLLDTLGQGEILDFPEFVPQVEIFAAALRDGPIPLETNAGLMQHYERTGEFAKAEDAFFSMLDQEPDNKAVLDFGVSFYQRLQCQSDDNLILGNLPRGEVEATLNQLRTKI
jgi:hypothetical protein